jgi:general secretion pathway protein D
MTGRKISGVIIAIVCLTGISAVIAQSPPRSPLKPWLSKALTELSTRVGTNEVKVVSKRVSLSYIDSVRAGQMLGLHGFTIGKLEEKVNQAGLPVIVPLPSTPSHESIPKAGEKFPLTETDPIGELIVFYDENQPGQISSVIATLREHIDVPARQIIIEAMILEISSTALKEMGVKWSRASGAKESRNFINSHLSELSIGSLKHPHPAADAALALTTKGIFHDLNAEIKALVRDGQAEVLSRPSVLALNNRMAYISVAEDIPVAKSSYAKSDYQTTSFAKEKAGITLALRPRIDATGEEVSMQVNAEVTARVPDADLEVRDKSNVLLASMPTISRREVRTYVRVANNTPFIIGGLIAKDKQSTVDKVPILGDIPLLGALFRSKKDTAVKREVIIVLTPFVLPEEYVSGKNMPKDEDAFDSVDNQLFRDAYRIRAEDTFDLNYLTQNHQLRSMKALATRIIAGDIGLAEQYPYNRFVGSAIPGEDILCHRQIYEVLKRQKSASKLDANKLIFFKPDRNIQSGFRVQFLQQYLAANAPHILTAKGGKTALAITFILQRSSDAAHSILKEPVPAVQLVDCPDEDTWSRLLWDLNKPDPESKPSFTVLMRNSRDIERLKYAVLMKKTVELNTKSQVLQLSNFTRGRLLLMPTVKPKDVELIDGDVARSFFYSEQYYQALQNVMEQDISAFRRVIEEKDHLKKLINPRRP